MIYEIRHYVARPGRRDDLARDMDETVIPHMMSHGMTVVGSYRDLEKDDTYVWIRGFDNQEQRAASLQAAYGALVWSEQMRPAIQELMDSALAHVDVVSPTGDATTT